MKYNLFLSKSFIYRLSIVFCVVLTTMVVSLSVYGQDYRRRDYGPITSNPVPAYPTSTPTLQHPATGVQNPTKITQPAQNIPTQTNQQNPNATAMPSSPFNTSMGVSTNPFQPTPSTGYGYGQTVAPVQQPTVQHNPFQTQAGTRPVQPATIGGQVSTQTIKRPFDDMPPQSPYSPYMYLYAGRNGHGSGGDNYNLYVRPMMEQEAYNKQMVQQVESLQQTIQRQQQQIQTQNRVLNQMEQEGIMPTQGPINTNPNSANQYYNQQYQQYFNTQGR